jgi:molybdopterin molybdotransferase
MGRTPRRRPQVRAISTQRLSSPPGRRQYARGWFEVEPDGARVRPVGGQGSHLLGGLASANALIVVPEDTTVVEEGDAVEVMVLDRDF